MGTGSGEGEEFPPTLMSIGTLNFGIRSTFSKTFQKGPRASLLGAVFGRALLNKVELLVSP